MKIFKSICVLVVLISSISCVQKTHLKTVTFRLNMRSIENPYNVGLRGNFTEKQWKETMPLTDENKDGIYEGTFSQKTAANQVEFKFLNQNSDFELVGSDNRILRFEYKPETIIYEATYNNPKEKITKK